MKACENKSCEIYPYYGLAPHGHDLSRGAFIGSTVINNKEDWPHNFIEDKDAKGCGVYHCPDCGKKYIPKVTEN